MQRTWYPSPRESEYLVSDSRIASSIDLVMENAAREVVLADIKTTSGGIDRTTCHGSCQFMLIFLSCRQAS